MTIPSLAIRCPAALPAVRVLPLVALVAAGILATASFAARAGAPAAAPRALAALLAAPVPASWHNADGTPPGGGGDPGVVPSRGPQPAPSTGARDRRGGGDRPDGDSTHANTPGAPGPWTGGNDGLPAFRGADDNAVAMSEAGRIGAGLLPAAGSPAGHCAPPPRRRPPACR